MNEAHTTTRRSLELQQQIEAHGGTGFPLDGLTPAEACRAGICLKCGGQWDALHTHIWKHFPGLTMREGIQAYREEFEIAADTQIDSDAHRKTLQRAKLKTYKGANGKVTRAKLSAAGKGNTYHRAAVPNWPLMRLLTQGHSPEAVHGTLKLDDALTPHAIGARARSMGFSFGTPARCDHGSPFLNGSLYRLRELTGFECSEFERRVRLSEGRSAATRPDDSVMNPADAEKVIHWRDELIRELLRVASVDIRGLRLGEKIFRQDEILASLLPQLPHLNAALVLTMRDIHREAQKNPAWDVAALGEYVCTKAAIEESGMGPDQRWCVTLMYLWQAEPFLNLPRLRVLSADGVGVFTRQMIGSPYGASADCVQNALRERTDHISRSDMAALIIKFSDAPQARARIEELKAKIGGRPDKAKRDRQAAELSAGGMSPRQIAQRLEPEAFKQGPDAATEMIRTALKRLNRRDT